MKYLKISVMLGLGQVGLGYTGKKNHTKSYSRNTREQTKSEGST